MGTSLSCYFLDEPLQDEERQFVERALLGPWSKFKARASSMVDKRVPLVLPTPDAAGHYFQSPEQRADVVRRNLRHAGIQTDLGRQVLWVMPADPEWDAIFQFAIREETGFGPFVAQRWYRDGERVFKGKLRVIDTQMLIEGLE